MKKQELKFEIINHIGTISESSSGWRLELNRISWNGNKPKYDLRSWSSDHQRMSKGITISDNELISLSALLDKEVMYLKDN